MMKCPYEGCGGLVGADGFCNKCKRLAKMHPSQKRVLIAVMVVVSGVILVACAAFGIGLASEKTKSNQPDPSHLTREDIGTAWPLTVDDVYIECRRGMDAIATDPTGTEYALNGQAQDDGFAPIDPIWKKNAGGRIDISPVLDPAVALCRS